MVMMNINKQHATFLPSVVVEQVRLFYTTHSGSFAPESVKPALCPKGLLGN
jgi:hypothetical protein